MVEWACSVGKQRAFIAKGNPMPSPQVDAINSHSHDMSDLEASAHTRSNDGPITHLTPLIALFLRGDWRNEVTEAENRKTT